MIKRLLILMLLCSPVFGGVKYSFSDPKMNDELDNNYKEHTFPNIINGRASTMTITQLNVSTITVSGRIVFKDGTTQSTGAKYIQAVTQTNTTAFSTTSSAFQLSNSSVTITPTSSSSRVQVTFTNMCRSDAANNGEFVSIFRGSTDLQAGTGGFSGMNLNLANPTFPCSGTVIDSPATTSATIYSIKIASENGVGTVRIGGSGVTQVITAEEIQ